MKSPRKRIEAKIARLQEQVDKAKGELSELQWICTHANARTVNVPGDYYSKGYSYKACPDCGKGENK